MGLEGELSSPLALPWWGDARCPAPRGRAGGTGMAPRPSPPTGTLTPGVSQSLALGVGEEPVGLKLFAPERRSERYASVT